MRKQEIILERCQDSGPKKHMGGEGRALTSTTLDPHQEKSKSTSLTGKLVDFVILHSVDPR